jgi:pimeloyl-ACP methyl ester carboxylesterase
VRLPLLYVPGLDGTGRLLYRQRQLFDDFDVHCVSFPEDRRLNYTDLADIGTGALEQNAKGERAVVLAESFGGAVALTMALRRPELIERLVLVNTFAYYSRRLHLYIANLAGGFFPPRRAHPMTRFFRSVFFFGPGVPPFDRNEWWERTAEVPMRAYALRMHMIRDLDLRPRLGEIDIPALVLAAPNDRVVPPAAGRCLARLLPRASLVEMAVGHAALAHPDVNIAQFLGDPAYWKRPGL